MSLATICIMNNNDSMVSSFLLSIPSFPWTVHPLGIWERNSCNTSAQPIPRLDSRSGLRHPHAVLRWAAMVWTDQVYSIAGEGLRQIP